MRRWEAFFRVDASQQIGHGHVIRCLALATALRAQGALPTFICREHPGHLCDLIEQRGFSVRRLPAPESLPPAEARPAYAEWLGASWQMDAEQSLAAIKATGNKPDWLIVDHYAIDRDWEQALRPAVDRIMAIDDLADRAHDCDLLLDQNLSDNMRERYRKRVPDNCIQLYGPSFALLQKDYALLRKRAFPRSGPIRRIFIFFSGADYDHLGARSLSAFLGLNRPDIEVDLVANPADPRLAALLPQVGVHANIHFHSDLPTLAPLILKADMALGACGVTAWERMCLGLPTLGISLSENQRPIAEESSRRNLIHYLGHHDTVDEPAIAAALREAISRGADKASSERALASVDGMGCYRVCAALLTTAESALHIRPANLHDDEKALSGFVSKCSTPLDPGRFLDLRNAYRDSENTHLYVVETEVRQGRIALGLLYWFRKNDLWRHELWVAPHCSAQTLETAMLEVGLLRLRLDTSGILGIAPMVGQLSDASPWNLGICSDQHSWINSSLPRLIIDCSRAGRQVSWAHDAALLTGGDVCLYLSYGRITGSEVLARYRHNLVIHESRLPLGRGWSPLTWQVLEGAERIAVTLFEAADAVDCGPIYLQEEMLLDGHELVDDLRRKQAASTLRLCRAFLANYPESASQPQAQTGAPTYFRRRAPADGQLDIELPLRAQFNLLRVSDNQRYPAWFEIFGQRYRLLIEKTGTGHQERASDDE